MKKIMLHFMIWAISIVTGLILYNKSGAIYDMLRFVWIINLLFWIFYYQSRLWKKKVLPKDMQIAQSDVASARCCGIFFNMFLAQCVLETYHNLTKTYLLFAVSLVFVLAFRKSFLPFFADNQWKWTYLGVYLPMIGLTASIDSFLGNYIEEIKLLDADNVSIVAKIVLVFFMMLLTYMTIYPDSFFMRVSARNRREEA